MLSTFKNETFGDKQQTDSSVILSFVSFSSCSLCAVLLLVCFIYELSSVPLNLYSLDVKGKCPVNGI